MSTCQTCESLNAQKKGRGRPRKCDKCKKAGTSPNNLQYEEDLLNGTGVISGRVPHHMAEAELIEYFQIDVKVWSIAKIIYAEHEGYRKDRTVDWKVQNGKVISGEVHDSGKLRIEPMIGVKVVMHRKVIEQQNTERIDSLIEKARQFSPKYPKLKYPKLKDPVLYEIQMPDLQLGRVVSASETGQDLTPDIAVQLVRKSIHELVGYARLFPVERIVFPIGHDFFDANNAAGTTAHGTAQRDDPRWQRTFRLGRDLLIECIDEMSALAPVDVPVIVGNHDEERMFYMGELLAAWYHKHPHVQIDATEKKRKYYVYGNNLLGFTHGYYEKLSELSELMSYEAPQDWARSTHREFHVGDKHHMKVFRPMVEERKGVVVRLLRSPAPSSVWEFDKGFVGALNAIESFVWHPIKGNIAQFTA